MVELCGAHGVDAPTLALQFAVQLEDEAPEEVRKRIQAHFVNHISELIPLALRPK